MKKVRLGIIGLGAQGSMYAKFITDGMVPNTVLAAVADVDPERRASSAEQYPEVPTFEDYRAMLESGDVDAVVTCIPHYLHPEVAIEALRHDIHVLVEKPAGVYSAQVRELNEFAASKPDLTFAIMFNQRNNPLYIALKEIIDGGQIGSILRSNWIITNWWRPQGYYDQSDWRATWGGEGGGVLVNQAPHQLDLWQWLCGVPKSVFAKAAFGFRRDIAVEDEVSVLADFGDGVTGVFVTATHDLVGTDRLEILGDQGKIVVEGSKTATITRLAKPERELSEGMGMDDVRRLFTGELDTAELYTQEVLEFDSAWGVQHSGVLENFAANILDGTPLLAPGADGIRGVRLANAIHMSSWTGQEVPLDLDEDAYLEELNKRIRAEGKFPERTR
ncbi:Gfo/Idh/MocA family oxidoreductase [Curtobacterium pusillum]|uniref:Dehydrogenase n=1 Tax=Curtobacterium pusillum TaxID=69373 RepID=A0AAW3T1X1_9MICO|nr:Gfo/Idh/MocA family oxidoreductase [Curtobacterium pusillum]MBA8989030.1 putative dehydrogenase [Curtobacterium pusillum]NUU12519.1 Gfo/Idh/MocA family oxidoreductase [Curtobacterium pusillum]GLK33030.1 dehydrogenase [Curtobacterium pusillum]